jgi:hypothetical protein
VAQSEAQAWAQLKMQISLFSSVSAVPPEGRIRQAVPHRDQKRARSNGPFPGISASSCPSPLGELVPAMLVVPYFESSAIHHDRGIELRANGWSELVSRSTCEQRNHLLPPRASCLPFGRSLCWANRVPVQRTRQAMLGPPPTTSTQSTPLALIDLQNHPSIQPPPSPSCTLLAVARPSWLVPQVQAEDLQPFSRISSPCSISIPRRILSCRRGQTGIVPELEAEPIRTDASQPKDAQLGRRLGSEEDGGAWQSQVLSAAQRALEPSPAICNGSSMTGRILGTSA